jgi:hypothetical protein
MGRGLASRARLFPKDPHMTFVPSDPIIGISPISAIDAAARHPIGTIRRFVDPTLGEGEFIYLPGAAGVAVGAAVTYDEGAGTVILVPNTANQGKPVAIAMAANTVTTSFSWHQIAGQAVVLTSGAVADGDPLFATATPGTLSHTAQTGRQVLNAQASSANGAAGTNLTFATINRPFLQGQIT